MVGTNADADKEGHWSGDEPIYDTLASGVKAINLTHDDKVRHAG